MSRRESTADLVLVDDDELVHLFVGRRLRRTALELEAFTDPERALEWLRAHRPRLLMLDHRMPVLSGLELLDALGGPALAAQRTLLCTAASGAAELERLKGLEGLTIVEKSTLLDRQRFLSLLGLPDPAISPVDDQSSRVNRSCSNGSASTSSGAV